MRSRLPRPDARLVAWRCRAARLDAAAPAKTEAELRVAARADRPHHAAGQPRRARARPAVGQSRAAELSVGQARSGLGRASRDYADRSARRAALAQQPGTQQQQALVSERAALAAQLRVAYMIGREEPLKLLLNQQDPLHSERLFAYYGYFGRARAEQIGKIQAHVQRLDELDTELAQQQSELATLKAAQQQPAAAARARAQRPAAGAGQPDGRRAHARAEPGAPQEPASRSRGTAAGS